MATQFYQVQYDGDYDDLTLKDAIPTYGGGLFDNLLDAQFAAQEFARERGCKTYIFRADALGYTEREPIETFGY